MQSSSIGFPRCSVKVSKFKQFFSLGSSILRNTLARQSFSGRDLGGRTRFLMEPSGLSSVIRHSDRHDRRFAAGMRCRVCKEA